MIITDSAFLWCFATPKVGALGEAQCAGNGRTLAKHCTKSRRPEATRLSAEHHRSALRVSLSRPTDCVSPLAKGTAITCEARLAVNLDKLTELAIIILKEHL